VFFSCLLISAIAKFLRGFLADFWYFEAGVDICASLLKNSFMDESKS
jgi:hypothetical protein